MFSATGNILTGSQDRPDTYTILEFSEKEGTLELGGQLFPSTVKNVSISSTNCKFNKIGNIPVVSIITGCVRTLLGIVHAIVHLGPVKK